MISHRVLPRLNVYVLCRLWDPANFFHSYTQRGNFWSPLLLIPLTDRAFFELIHGNNVLCTPAKFGKDRLILSRVIVVIDTNTRTQTQTFWLGSSIDLASLWYWWWFFCAGFGEGARFFNGSSLLVLILCSSIFCCITLSVSLILTIFCSGGLAARLASITKEDLADQTFWKNKQLFLRGASQNASRYDVLINHLEVVLFVKLMFVSL